MSTYTGRIVDSKDEAWAEANRLHDELHQLKITIAERELGIPATEFPGLGHLADGQWEYLDRRAEEIEPAKHQAMANCYRIAQADWHDEDEPPTAADWLRAIACGNINEIDDCAE